MSTLEDILSVSGDIKLSHMYDPAEYDPQQAHLYYEQHKKLKGRQKAAQPVPVGRRNPRAPTILKKHGAAKIAPHVKPKTPEQRRKEVEAKVAGLQHKLDHLKAVLAALVKQAKLLSGVKTPPKDNKTAAGNKQANAKLTPAEKKKAADYQKKYREQHQDTPEQHAQKLQQQIAEITTKIRDMKAQLAAAREEASKRTSSSVGARANPNR